MNQLRSLLHVGLVDFADSTLLLIGDAASLRWLAEKLDARRPIDFGAEKDSVRQVNVELSLICSAKEAKLTRQGNAIDLDITSTDSKKFSEQLRALAASDTAAHAYLDFESNTSGIEVIASKGEYNPENVVVS